MPRSPGGQDGKSPLRGPRDKMGSRGPKMQVLSKDDVGVDL